MIRSSLDSIENGPVQAMCQIEELSCSIKPFDIRSACFILRHSFVYFPKGSVHLLCVRCESLSEEGVVVVEMSGHFFVGANDGRFSLLADEIPSTAYEISADSDSGCTAKLFVKAVQEIISGKLSENRVVALKRVAREVPVVMKDKIIGHVVFIDSYGNAITDISKSLFVKSFLSDRGIIGRDPNFTIFVHGPYLEFDSICSNYTDIESGATAAIFNSLDLLEIGIRNGNFSAMENIDTTTEITIQWRII